METRHQTPSPLPSPGVPGEVEPIDTRRYHRQTILPFIGDAGQRRLGASAVAIVGCGALGTVMADQLARAGVGRLLLIDRDIVELTNLQRQVLFDESDAAGSLPKAVAAADRLRRINSSISITPVVADLHVGNIEEMLIQLSSGSLQAPVQLILDASDNIQTRYLLNDFSIKHNIPWIYTAAVSAEGRIMPILPNQSACLRCIFPTPPAAADLPTCDTAGILAAASNIAASFAVSEAIHILTAQNSRQQTSQTLLSFTLLPPRLQSLTLSRDLHCPCCAGKLFEFLSRPASPTTTLCGRDSIQIRPNTTTTVDLAAVARRLSAVGAVQLTPYLLRCSLLDPPNIQLTLFPDGRLLIHGTTDPARARSIAARFIGA